MPAAPLVAMILGQATYPSSNMALAVRILTAAVVSAFAWIFQRRMIYLPAGQPTAAPEQLLEGGSAVVLHTEDGLDLTAWHRARDRTGHRHHRAGVAGPARQKACWMATTIFAWSSVTCHELGERGDRHVAHADHER